MENKNKCCVRGNNKRQHIQTRQGVGKALSGKVTGPQGPEE